MANDELVALYEATRRWAAGRRTWRLRVAAGRARRALHRDPGSGHRQVRVVALEHELRRRGALAAPTLPVRPPPPHRPARRPARRWWRWPPR